MSEFARYSLNHWHLLVPDPVEFQDAMDRSIALPPPTCLGMGVKGYYLNPPFLSLWPPQLIYVNKLWYMLTPSRMKNPLRLNPAIMNIVANIHACFNHL